MAQEEIEKLKHQVEGTFGRNILTASDCNELSEDVNVKCNARVHSNTLRRFFGLIKSPFHASASTLNILAQYCGFTSLEELADVDDCTKKLAYDANEMIRYFYSVFKYTRVSSKKDEVFLSIIEQVIIFINRNEHLADRYNKKIAKTKNGQDFYFEKFINMDRLNSYYGDGLRYYINEKRTDEAQIFAHSLLVLRYWLVKDSKKLEARYQSVVSHKVNESIHPFICGRYYASQLYYADITGCSTEDILIDAHKTFTSLKAGKYNKAFPCFEFTFSEALVLTKHYDTALYYLKDVVDKYKIALDYKEQGFYQFFDILKATAYACQGQCRTALKIFKNIRPAEFHFLSRKYKTMMYLILFLKLQRKSAKRNDQLNELIRLTGFLRLKEVILTLVINLCV